MALVVLVALAAGGFIIFRRVVGASSPAPGGLVASPVGTPTRPEAGVGSPGPQPSGQKRPAGGQRILRLRDYVAGVVNVSDLNLTADQKKKFHDLLPRVQEYMKDSAVKSDAGLESDFKAVLTPAQKKSIEDWFAPLEKEPDFQKDLKRFEELYK